MTYLRHFAFKKMFLMVLILGGFCNHYQGPRSKKFPLKLHNSIENRNLTCLAAPNFDLLIFCCRFQKMEKSCGWFCDFVSIPCCPRTTWYGDLRSVPRSLILLRIALELWSFLSRTLIHNQRLWPVITSKYFPTPKYFSITTDLVMMIDKGKLSLEIASFEGIAPSQTDVQQVVVGGDDDGGNYGAWFVDMCVSVSF